MKARAFSLLIMVVGLGGHAYAADCNPKAQVHQQRLSNIQFAMSLNGYVPNADDEAFVLCMLPEKEDRQAFENKLHDLRAAQAQRQAQEAAAQKAASERAEAQKREADRQAAIHQAQLPQFLAKLPPGLPGAVVKAAQDYYNAPNHKVMYLAWDTGTGRATWGTSVQQNSLFAADTNASPACANGRQQYGVQARCILFLSEDEVVWNPAKAIGIQNGVYGDASKPCGAGGQISVNGSNVHMGRTDFSLVANGQGAFDALTNGNGSNGTIGYDFVLTIISPTEVSWGQKNWGAIRYRMCQSQSQQAVPISSAVAGSRTSLRVGAYVEKQATCGTASNATLMWFTGKVFKMGGVSDITPTASPKPNEFHLHAQETREGGEMNATITVTSPTSYSWGPSVYEYCADSSLPATWRGTNAN